MHNLQTALLILQVFIALGLIVIILLQHGKGADAGAAFGSGASSTVFGSRGSGNFLTKATSGLAILFLVNSLMLAHLATQVVDTGSLMERAVLTDDLPMLDEDAASPEPPAADPGDEMPAIPGQ